RCRGVTPSKRRCKRRGCIGFSLCAAHNASRYGVECKVSTITNARRGLFATTTLPKDSWICPYIGGNTTMSSIHRLYPGETTAPYAVQLANGLAVDS
ncbi:unnamed protein product, partial [Ectocarpus sp. 6 AP-2014]